MKDKKQLKTNRNLFVYIILSLITCGIYSIYFLYALKRDTNIACAEDGKKTRGIIAMFLLTIITCGIYAIVWEVKLMTRHHEYCVRNGIKKYASFGTFYLWTMVGGMFAGYLFSGLLVADALFIHLTVIEFLIGAAICLFPTFIFTLIAYGKFLKTVNRVMKDYNNRVNEPEVYAEASTGGSNNGTPVNNNAPQYRPMPNAPQYPYGGYSPYYPPYYGPQAPNGYRPQPPRKPF